jgi:threonine dehydrogenase-like Zn-dependent dehydrogenase
MKAVLYDGQLRLADDYVEPNAREGEARVRMTLAGICNTDFELVRGYSSYRGVLGHEFVGIVDQADDAALIGRRVVGEINTPCGSCAICQSGQPAHCPDRTALGIRGRDGVLAECFLLPDRNLHLVPDDMPDEVAVFTEPLAAACEVPEQVHVRPRDQVLVLGDGKLGLLVAQVLALTGCGLTVVGRHQKKLSILASRGIQTRLQDEARFACADIVVECTGQPEGFDAAQRLVRPRGTVVLKSTYHGRTQADLSSIVVDEVTVVGSRCGPFPAALRLLKMDLVDVAPLVTAEYGLQDALKAFEHAGRRDALKVLVRP